MTADALDRLLGRSPVMAEVRHRVRALVAHCSPRLPSLLIEGETGTGKGLLARALHEASPRVKAPFIDVNCAAIPETLLETELFGYAAGAFSSARRAKPGLITTAHGGTLFLDELAALPLSLQAKLLTVVEEQKVRPLGSTQVQIVDVWILSATSEDLEAAAREGRFRRDLYHRLARLELRLPPLRERGDDVLLLARHFLARTAREYGIAESILAPDADVALRRYSWPGNIRELANLMERLTLLGEGATIGAAALEFPAWSAGPWQQDVMQDRATTEMARSRRPPVPAAPVRRRDGSATRVASSRDVVWQLRRIAVLKVESTAQAFETPGLGARGRAIARGKVEAFGGTAGECDDVGVLGVFGLEPSEDAPVRAAYAAMAVVTALRRAFDGQAPVVAAIELVDGRVGERGRRRVLHPDDGRTALDRLRPLLLHARPGDVVVSVAARPHLERAFDDAPLRDAGGAVRLVGARGAFIGTVRRRLSAFVGREHELSWLARQMEGLAPGRGRAIGLIGEPGAGKSRLLHELRAVGVQLGVTWLDGRCVDHGTATPYLPLIDLIRRSLGVDEAADSAAATLGKRLRQAGLEPEHAVPYLDRLLGLPGGARVARLSPETVRARTFEVVGRIIQPGQGPVVVAIEDVHWIDRTSEALLGTLVDALPTTPLLLIVTYRAGYRPPWIARSTAAQLAVRPLDAAAGHQIVTGILRARGLDEAATERLVRQAEGNPFLLEELAWSADLTDGPTRGVPGTIRDTLSARIDQLPARSQRLLRIASVLGREAPRRLIEALTGNCGAMDRDLDVLIARGFVHEHRSGRGSVYVFKHALTREVIYDQLALPERQSLHAAAAREIEHSNAEGLDAVLADLAHHWAHSGDDGRAVDYLVRFADRATARYALEEALEALDRGLHHAKQLPHGRHRELAVLGCVVRMGVPLLFLGRVRDALNRLLAYRQRVDAVDAPSIAGPYHFVVSSLHDHVGELDLAFEHSQRAIEDAERCGDALTKGQAYVVRSHTHMWRGELSSAIGAAERALEALRATSEPFWIGMSYWMLGLNHIQAGNLLAGEEAGRRLLEIATAHADRRLECYAGCIIGMVSTYRAPSAAGVDVIAQARTVAPDPLTQSVALLLLGAACLEIADPEQARRHLQSALDLLQSANMPHVWNWAASFLVVAAGALGNASEAHAVGDRVLARTGDREFPQARARVLRALARLANAQSELVSSQLAEALRLFELAGARLEEARARVDIAVLVGLSDAERRKHLLTALETFHAVGASRDAAETERILGRIGLTN
jgi:transcriptional regulator with AAA-type ATPase domain/tetratricopeptide (TPR) repeat protein